MSICPYIPWLVPNTCGFCKSVFTDLWILSTGVISLCMCVCVCVCVCVWLCGQVVKALDCQLKEHRFKFHQLPLEKKIFLHLAPNPGPSKTVNLGPSGWGKTRPLAVPSSTEVQVGLWVAITQWRGIVCVPASCIWLLARGRPDTVHYVLSSIVPKPHPLTRRNRLVDQVDFPGVAHTFDSVT